MKQVEFCPGQIEFKKPIGAIKVNENAYFKLKFSRPSNPDYVYLCLTKDGETEVKYRMHYVDTSPDGKYTYETNLKITSKGLYFYYFLVETPTEDYPIKSDDNLYAMLGRGQDWQLTVFEDIYAEPAWLKGGIIYQIMTDRFFIGGERLKTKKGIVYRDDWGGVPEYKPDSVSGKILNNDMFGGNIKGITKKLAYLKSLGVTCIYLNPIFEAHSNHKYDTGNYRKIDPDFGTVEDFKDLIKKADKKGIKIVLDGVFSHTGDDSLYFNKYGNYDSVGAYQGKDSPYYEWYNFKNDNCDDYDCWWNIDILPNTNETDKTFDEFVNGQEGIIRYWTDMGIGGWRLDVVDELPDKFLDNLARAAKKSKPDALVLGEVWEDASNKVAYSYRRRYLNGGQLDSVMNYPYKEDIIHFIKTGDADKLYKTIKVLKNNYPKKVFDTVMNLLGTHDTARILTVLGDNGDISTRDKRANAKVTNLPEAIKLVKMATALQFLLPGVPCIYYGDEIGMEGFEDPFNRRCFSWNNKNTAMLKWYKILGRIRNDERSILSEGDYLPIDFGENVFAFRRQTDNTDQRITVIANNSGKDLKLDIENFSLTNLIDYKAFYGTVKDKEVAIVKLTKEVNFPYPKQKNK